MLKHLISPGPPWREQALGLDSMPWGSGKRILNFAGPTQSKITGNLVFVLLSPLKPWELFVA